MRLYVIYDTGCGLCSAIVQWMSCQASSYELRFVGGGSDEARRLFPELPNPARPEELVAVSDDGSVYRGEAAYIICLYALEAYRTLAVRLARPPFRPFARRVFTMLSSNRMRLSDFLGLRSDEALARALVTNPAGRTEQAVW
jgi:predicted DCC family thiol-disulfide oxidoreductase YuxK